MPTAQIDDVVVQALVAVGALHRRALVARARGDEAPCRDLADRYRAMATSLDFEGRTSGPRRWRDRGGSRCRPPESLEALPALSVRIGARCTGSPASASDQ